MMYVLSILIQHITRSSSHCNKERNRNKRYTDLKGRNKLSLNTDEMIVACISGMMIEVGGEMMAHNKRMNTERVKQGGNYNTRLLN